MNDIISNLIYDENYKPHIILNKLIKIAIKLNFTKVEKLGDGQGKKVLFWKDELNYIEFEDNIDYPSIHIDSSIEDIFNFKEEMDFIFKDYSYSNKNHNRSFYFDLTKY